MKFRIGDRVRVCHCSGMDSNKTGTVVDRNKVKTSGRGVATNVQGHYAPVNWHKEVAIQLDSGELITMFKNRLIKEV